MRRRNLFAGLGAAMALPRFALAAPPAHIGFVSGGDEKGAASFIPGRGATPASPEPMNTAFYLDDDWCS